MKSFENIEKTVKKEIKKAVAVGTVAVTVLGTGMARETLDNHKAIKEARERDIVATEQIDTTDTDIINLSENNIINDIQQIRENKIVSCFCSGIYVIFWFLVKVAFNIFSALSAPIVHFVILFLGILAAILIGIKVKYPDLPIHKIMSKKTLKSVVIFSVLLFISTTLCEIYIEDFEKYIHLFELIIGMAFSIFIIIFIKPKKKNTDTIKTATIETPDGSKFIV